MISAADLPILEVDQVQPDYADDISAPAAAVANLNARGTVKPGIVITNTMLMLRMESQDILKVKRGYAECMFTDMEMLESQSNECFQRVHSTSDGGLICYDTRDSTRKWIPIPIALFNGTVYVTNCALGDWVLYMSRVSPCKVSTVISRATAEAFKFEVEQFEAADKLFRNLQDKVAGKSSSPEFLMAACSTFMHNPLHKLNQLGGGTILLSAPSNTIRLVLKANQQVTFDKMDVVAYTSEVTLIYMSKHPWWKQFCSMWQKSVGGAKGPGVLWLSARKGSRDDFISSVPKAADRVIAAGGEED